MVVRVQIMLEMEERGAMTFDYGNFLRGQVGVQRGMENAFDFPGFVPAFIRPLFCRGAGPFRWAALSGNPADIAATDKAILELFPEKDHPRRWIDQAQHKIHFHGLPARISPLDYGQRADARQKTTS